MVEEVPTEKDLLKQVTDMFWDAFPPFWHHIRAYIRETATENFDITVEQYHILRHIHHHEKGSVSDLADAKHISRPAISRTVDVLVNKGLITRTSNPEDRRYVQLTLTGAGQELLRAVFESTQTWMMSQFAALDKADLIIIMQALHVMKKLSA